MKFVSGKVVSIKPISVSKSAKILSNFISVEIGASQSVSVYLKRASASFDQLVQFHKDLKPPHSDRKHNESEQDITTDRKHKNDPRKSIGIEECTVRKRDKKEKREGGGSVGIEKKKRTNGEVYDGDFFDSMEQSGSKKKKRII